MIAIVWEFIVKDEAVDAFQRAYGPDGEWAVLFRQHPGYAGTTLLQNTTARGRFLTMDRWENESLFEQMHHTSQQEYSRLDARMSPDRMGLFRFGGVAFMISGALFFIRYILDVMAGPPPSTGSEIIAWVEANRLVLSLVSEVLFFASMSLVPAVIALYLALVRVERTLAATGCGIIAVAVPVLGVLLIVHGRLVYPVYGLHVSDPAVAELVVALFYGGLHAVGLLMAVATFVLSLAMRRGAFGAPVATLGFATAVGDTVGAYPYLISPVVLFGCQFLFTAWFVAVGWTLFRIHDQGRE